MPDFCPLYLQCGRPSPLTTRMKYPKKILILPFIKPGQWEFYKRICRFPYLNILTANMSNENLKIPTTTTRNCLGLPLMLVGTIYSMPFHLLTLLLGIKVCQSEYLSASLCLPGFMAKTAIRGLDLRNICFSLTLSGRTFKQCRRQRRH